MEITRLTPAGAVTREWLVGHADPESAQVVVITRAQLYPLPARVGPAWYWLYSYQADDGPRREYGRGLAELRRFIRRTFPNATVTEAWARLDPQATTAATVQP